MAYYFIFPEKDSTLYSHPDRKTLNTGKDELLELIKEKGSNNSSYYPSRILIKFSNSDIQTAVELTNGVYFSNLQLFSTEHTNLASEQSIEVFPISKSWDEGTGRYSDSPQTSNGCSWTYTDNDISQNKWVTSSFAINSTGSISNKDGMTPGGGEWYTGDGFKKTQTFSNADLLDLDVDVTSVISKYYENITSALPLYPTSIPNYGFLIKSSDAVEEFTSGSNGNLQYFSIDTHTIYPPRLCFKWDDSIHNSQSLAKTSGDLSVSLYNNKAEYNQNDVAKIKIHVRDKYPNRTFVTSSNYLNVGYFKTSSYYSIRDAHTEEVVIPFDDNYSKLSADNEGMYFNLHMNGLQPERHYRILFKHINNDGTQIYDDNYHFKVVR